MIDETAEHHSVHPSCVIGRIQHDNNLWSLMRSEIPKVKEALRAAALLAK